MSPQVTTTPPISNRVRFDDSFIGNEPNVLLCPRCGFQYLQHYAVTAYDRHEDAEYSTKTAIRCQMTFSGGPDGLVVETEQGRTIVETERSSESRNPSSRRHGLAISFFCEGCHETSELTFDQRKGNTILAWREI
jgi:hypothetical protein